MTTRHSLSDKEANELSKNGSKHGKYGIVIPKVKIPKIYKKNYRFERKK